MNTNQHVLWHVLLHVVPAKLVITMIHSQYYPRNNGLDMYCDPGNPPVTQATHQVETMYLNDLYSMRGEAELAGIDPTGGKTGSCVYKCGQCDGCELHVARCDLLTVECDGACLQHRQT